MPVRERSRPLRKTAKRLEPRGEKNALPRILNKNGLIAALDIGTSKTCCVLARPVEADKALITGAGSHRSKGLKKGMIVNLPDVIDSVRNAVENAEKEAGERIETVVTNVTARQFSSELLHASLSLGGTEVTQSDISRLITKARNKIEKNGDEILHCIPTEYRLDDAFDIRDPRGLFGDTLSVSLHKISTPPAPVRNMNAVLEQCHLTCARKVASPYAAGLACLREEEMQQGSAVIDLGAGTTGIGVFYEGQPVFVSRLPVGGNHITEDLTVKFKTAFADAERIKTLNGSVYPSERYSTEEIDIPLLGEDARISIYRVPRIEMVNVIIMRVREIFELVRRELKQSGFYDLCLNFVLTGGGSQLQGVREMASSVLQKNARIGQPVGLEDPNAIILPASYPIYTGCFGQLRYALNARTNIPAHQKDLPKNQNGIIRFFQWFLDNC